MGRKNISGCGCEHAESFDVCEGPGNSSYESPTSTLGSDVKNAHEIP